MTQATNAVGSLLLGQHVEPHPLGVRPSGNAISASDDAWKRAGTFATLPDELILTLLEWLEASDLLRLGQTCRAFFALTCFDDLWKSFFVQQCRPCTSWRGTWRATYLARKASSFPYIDCALYSDAIYRPYFCSRLDVSAMVSNISSANKMSRMASMSPAEFTSSWSNNPFILTEPVKSWPAYDEWQLEALLKQYGHIQFRAEAVEWSLNTYIEYLNNNSDESPLYLFDSKFVEKMDLSTEMSKGIYWPPECFGEDLFALLGNRRPDSRWLIIGPERSGSTFHKDPNATSAWNAVIRGSKYWIMFPPTTTPPGVFVSEDESEVTSPLSISEWVLNFHEEAKLVSGCVEGICHQGEVVHVPSGWWHLVVNLEAAIAVTQNFIPLAHLSSAINFLKYKPAQVSGFDDLVQNPHELFIDELTRHGIDTNGFHHKQVNGKKRNWDDLVAQSDNNDTQSKKEFSFGFASDLEE